MIKLYFRIKKIVFQIYTKGSINGYVRSVFIIFLRTIYRFFIERKGSHFGSDKFPLLNSDQN